MPDPRNEFTEGKYGNEAAEAQYALAMNAAMLYTGEFDTSLYNSMLSFKNRTPEKFADKKTSANVKKKMDEFKKKLNVLNSASDDKALKFRGYMNLAEKLMDTGSGDFGSAVNENTYPDIR